ncbi:DAK2 domain-containing protein [Halanaerobium sp. Z-7514]|uniref:DAK2 domain-containing protein n=1 Tax=Halanaerobium polyolivorans TaxID=2886943 RepID=A0AAW4WZB0_9FIRM|nr:DAK2 domain-containing protein [Halanaerobium polyolivorans]MCC3144784.1 DAK2 domain-containing protein [Halanaerobium polyolivorans]
MTNNDKQQELKTIDSENFRDMIIAALNWLQQQKSFIDSLNVFPVPDGDTGTNMFLTFKEAAAALENNDSNSCSDLAQSLSKGALMGARGNSGVILSQLIRGFSQSLKGKKKIRAKDLAQALNKASEVAYHGVLKPVEGTILTVAREAAEQALKTVEDTKDIFALMEATIEEAEESLARTPELLDVLKEAEVVDAGGQGYVSILKGMLRGLKGEEIDYEAAKKELRTQKSTVAEDIKFTYCTQLLIEVDTRNKKIDRMISKIKHDMQSYGDSIMVVGDDDIIKIHVHTNHPGVLLEYGLKKGKVFDIKIDNMKKQNIEKVEREKDSDFDHSEFHFEDQTKTEAEESEAEIVESDEKELEAKDNGDEVIEVSKNTAIISVANGEGIINILKELGVDFVIEGGQSMNPSTNDFVQAVEKMNIDNIIILPNNKNIISAAKQVSEVSNKNIAIIETKSIPQAVSALMVYDDQLSPEELKKEMEAEIEYVKTLEITQAVKDSKVNGMEIKEGDYIGLCDGDIIVTAEEIEETVISLLDKTNEAEELVTIYYGEQITKEEAEKLKEKMQEKYDFDEIEAYEGGQPLYPYIISLE